jgi:hypothetical protein
MLMLRWFASFCIVLSAAPAWCHPAGRSAVVIFLLGIHTKSINLSTHVFVTISMAAAESSGRNNMSLVCLQPLRLKGGAASGPTIPVTFEVVCLSDISLIFEKMISILSDNFFLCS